MGNEALQDIKVTEESMINVEIAYALPDEQTLLKVSVTSATSIKEAILQSGILTTHPELDVDDLHVGLFGKLSTLKQIVRDRDRVEIYRPLIADPKEVRKKKAAEGKRLKKGGSTTSDAEKNKKSI